VGYIYVYIYGFIGAPITDPTDPWSESIPTDPWSFRKEQISGEQMWTSSNLSDGSIWATKGSQGSQWSHDHSSLPTLEKLTYDHGKV
jgi:hypothetical protein